jgi:hypothetical protein
MTARQKINQTLDLYTAQAEETRLLMIAEKDHYKLKKLALQYIEKVRGMEHNTMLLEMMHPSILDLSIDEIEKLRSLVVEN